MSAPQANPKNNRHATRTSKPTTQNLRSVVSENEAYTNTDHQPAHTTKPKQGKRSHAKKQSTSHDAAVHSDGPSQRSVAVPMKTQATPVKQQAYAGPTFHQSPAASALPLPSFYSKSLPSAGLPKPAENEILSPGLLKADQSRPASAANAHEPVRESTPLDFLFDAARKAQVTPGAESPQHRYHSPMGHSPAGRSPAIREQETQFPFEFDSAEAHHEGSEPTFVTPYKERIEAVRSTRGTPDAGRVLQESERQAKTVALKNFLRQSSQESSGAGDNPFNARPAPVQPALSNNPYSPAQGMKHRSSSGTPMRNGYSFSNNGQYFPPIPTTQNGPASPAPRPPSSNLRNIYSPDFGRTPAELASNNQAQQSRISTARQDMPSGQQYRPEPHSSVPYLNTQEQEKSHESTKPSVQQMEDDLRRVLKLDLTSRG